ncbi:unnamed protein product [Peronospora destructor]|uniref:C2 domain-containing protein n=1 Tax=Peronospora destructor TaxID=86335 RepID=A0AAV0U0Y2_9STRA|nr:unnamed protein product [Peronospora destructor]
MELFPSSNYTSQLVHQCKGRQETRGDTSVVDTTRTFSKSLLFTRAAVALCASVKDRTVRLNVCPEHYVFPITDASNSVLTVEVFDMDTINPDDLLGIINVAVAKFADEMEVSTLENYPLSLESEFAGQKRNSTLLLEICLKQVDDQRVYMWENESWSIGSEWKPTNSSERRQLSSYDDSATSAMFVEVEPRAPANMTDTSWQYCSNRGDEQGWRTAKTFAGPWTPTKPAFSFVRRRLWENRFKREIDSRLA